jgi:hypothetical protein
VLSVKEDTYLTDINGNIIRKYEGLLTRNLVWSPSGDSFWMSGYIVNARNGEIIGKVNDSPYTCAALFDMDSHRIAFADGNMIHVIDYQTQEKLLFIDNKEISYDTTVVLSPVMAGNAQPIWSCVPPRYSRYCSSKIS